MTTITDEVLNNVNGAKSSDQCPLCGGALSFYFYDKLKARDSFRCGQCKKYVTFFREDSHWENGLASGY